MGIVIDVVFLGIIVLSAFLGYKKGLVELGTKLFAGIIAIVLMLILYKPVSNLIINNTQIDDRIESTVIEKMSKKIDENVDVSSNKYIQNVTDGVTTEIKETTLPEYANSISTNIVYIITSILLFVVIKIALMFVTALADLVTKIPGIKQCNEIGGFVYGVVRGVLIVCICVLIMGVVVKMNGNVALSEAIDGSIVTQKMYEILIKF